MKRINIFMICALISVLTFAQDKWADIWCNTWNVMEYDMGMGEKNRETWMHYLAQDTIINEQTYSVVNYYWTLEETKVYKIAFVRFTEDKKVYLLRDNTEYLVYDFSVHVGDTIEAIVGAFWGDMSEQLLVREIHTDIETNLKTIILYRLCPIEDLDEITECCPIEWIEGVGSTDGFLMGYPVCNGWTGGIGCSLLCAHKDDELKYYHPRYYERYGCEYNTVTAVEDIHTSESKVQKVIQDGQLLILHDGKTYNIMGMEIGQ